MSLIQMIPAHPSEGWASMNRYAAQVFDEANRQWPGKFGLAVSRERVALLTQRENRLKRAIKTRVAYPLSLWASRSPALFHLLDHSSAFLLRGLRRRGRPIVATVHDIIPLYAPNGLSSGQINRFRETLKGLHCADRILADSHHTKRDLVTHLGLDSERIDVSWLGVDPSFSPEGPKARGLDHHAIVLSVGSTIPRKNLEILPEIFSCIAGVPLPIQLVRIGAKLPPLLAAQIEVGLGKGKLTELGMVNDEALRSWYRAADAFLMPSKHEGFGLPVLEAMACGCPVVTSRASSLDEVAGEAALKFDPRHPAEAADALSRLLSDADLARHLRASGVDRAAEFTWRRHLADFTAVYRQLGVDLPSSGGGSSF